MPQMRGQMQLLHFVDQPVAVAHQLLELVGRNLAGGEFGLHGFNDRQVPDEHLRDAMRQTGLMAQQVFKS